MPFLQASRPHAVDLSQQELETRRRVAEEGVEACRRVIGQWKKLQKRWRGVHGDLAGALGKMDMAMDEAVESVRATGLHATQPLLVRLRREPCLAHTSVGP